MNAKTSYKEAHQDLFKENKRIQRNFSPSAAKRLPESVLQQCKPRISDAEKHNRTREEDLEGVEVETINLQRKPREEIVEDGTDGHSSDTIYARARQTVERGAMEEYVQYENVSYLRLEANTDERYETEQ